MSRYNCPNCRASITWSNDNPHRPFCSERCKLSDLDGWFNDEYTIPVEEPGDTGKEWDIDDHSAH